MIRVINMILTVLAGVGGAIAVYWILNRAVEFLPGKWEDRVKPYVFVGPAVAVIGLFLVYPTIQTLIYSFANSDSTAWVGFQNYTQLLTSADFLKSALLNTVLWVVFAPVVTVTGGLLIAVLADRLKPGAEKLSKTIIFLPMAISGVAAATIWNFVYSSQPAGTTQIGLLNAIWTKLGGSPIAWLQQSSFHANTFLLMVILVWGQIGFSMVLLSAAIKSVPEETLEAARIDGAGERMIFFRVVVPQIIGTVITVFITVLINVMKIFDIVYITTNGNFNTDVVANRFFNELFTNGNAGHAAAIVIMLLIAIIPVLFYQIHHFRQEEANR